MQVFITQQMPTEKLWFIMSFPPIKCCAAEIYCQSMIP